MSDSSSGVAKRSTSAFPKTVKKAKIDRVSLTYGLPQWLEGVMLDDEATAFSQAMRAQNVQEADLEYFEKDALEEAGVATAISRAKVLRVIKEHFKSKELLHGQDEPVKGGETTGDESDVDSDGSREDCFDTCSECYEQIEEGTGMCAQCREKER